MSLLYELRYFLTFAQISGFFPCVFDVNHRTRRIEKVAFVKTHPVFAWFTFLFLIQFLSVFALAYCVYVFMTEKSVYLNDLPFAVFALTGCSAITWYIVLFAARLMALQPKRIRRAIHLVNKVETLLRETGMMAFSRNSIKMRTFIAVAIIIISIVCGLMGASPLFTLYDALMGPYVKITIYVVFCSCISTVASAILFIHLNYYVIGCYVDCITELIKQESDSSVLNHKLFSIIRGTKKSSRTIIDCKIVFDQVCSVAREMNSLFSLPVFIMVTVRFIETVTNSYCVVYKLVKHARNYYVDTMFPMVVFGLYVGVLSVAVIFYAAETHIAKVRNLREHSVRFMTRCFEGAGPDPFKVQGHAVNQNLLEVSAFLSEIRDERVRLSAIGMFDVGTHLIPTLVGSVVTYLVILIQQV